MCYYKIPCRNRDGVGASQRPNHPSEGHAGIAVASPPAYPIAPPSCRSPADLIIEDLRALRSHVALRVLKLPGWAQLGGPSSRLFILSQSDMTQVNLDLEELDTLPPGTPILAIGYLVDLAHVVGCGCGFMWIWGRGLCSPPAKCLAGSKMPGERIRNRPLG